MNRKEFLKIAELCREGFLVKGARHKEEYFKKILLEIGFSEQYIEMLRKTHMLVRSE